MPVSRKVLKSRGDVMMPADRDLSNEVDRLKRRLERERKARIEAETIAERGLRELYTKKEELEFAASHDPLTGLSNRRQFHTEIARFAALADRKRNSFALLLIDLDRFKQINDTLGHDAGDALLVEAGRRMQLTVRLPDCVCRLGGDEFSIMRS